MNHPTRLLRHRPVVAAVAMGALVALAAPTHAAPFFAVDLYHHNNLVYLMSESGSTPPAYINASFSFQNSYNVVQALAAPGFSPPDWT